MMKRILPLLALMMAGLVTKAQIGIGTTTPDIYVMLDVTTPNNNKGILIPRVDYFGRTNPSNFGAALFPPPSEGMMIFDTDLAKFYYYNYNGVSPEGWRELDWDWTRIDAGSTIGSNIKLGVAGNVGIGTTNPQNKTTIVGNLAVGDSAWGAIAAPALGMTVKGRAGFGTSAPTPGYQVHVVGDQKVTGSVIVTDTVYATTISSQWAVPRGAILMWSGSIGTIPTGWALCDGGTYLGTHGSPITVPDLRERFIVGAGGDNPGVPGTGYAVSAVGGEVTHVLTTAELPAHGHSIDHGHSINDPGHSHSLPLDDATGSGLIDDAGSSPAGSINTSNATTNISINNFSGFSGNTGSNVGHENRPPYYAMAYIYKL